MRKIFIGIFLASALGLAAQSVTKLAATKANNYGIAYSLPKTTVNVILSAKKTVQTPGVFYNYAERYLGTDVARKAIARPSTTWQLTGAQIYTGAEVSADAEQYLMQFKGSQPVYVVVSPMGNPLAINSEDVQTAPAPPAVPKPTALTPTPLDAPAARYAVTEDMLNGTSLAKRAQFAADQILQLRQSRQDYLTGQAEQMPDGQALNIILQNIQAQEEALTAMFIGTTQTATDAMVVNYVPNPEKAAGDIVIARLNPLNGLVAADDLSGAPIILSTKVLNVGKLPLNDKGEKKTFPKGGIPYAIPGSARFSVNFNGKTIDSITSDVAQFGVVFGLDPSFFTKKKAPGYAIFDPLTGALREAGTN